MKDNDSGQKPLVQKESDFDPKNLQTIYKGMHSVAFGDEGTVRNIFKDFPIQIAGKQEVPKSS